MRVRDAAASYFLKAIGWLTLIAFITFSLYCFDKLPQKDKDFIIIMMMLSQPQ